MSPQEYIDRVSAGWWNNLSSKQKLEYGSFENYMEKEYPKRTDKLKVESYYEDALAGDKFPMPYINYSMGDFMLQEGNHRVEVARQLGIEKIPVIVVDEDWANTDTSFDDDVEKIKSEILDYLEYESLEDIDELFPNYYTTQDFLNENITDWWNEEISLMCDDAIHGDGKNYTEDQEQEICDKIWTEFEGEQKMMEYLENKKVLQNGKPYYKSEIKYPELSKILIDTRDLLEGTINNLIKNNDMETLNRLHEIAKKHGRPPMPSLSLSDFLK
jgi:hypothetical protein